MHASITIKLVVAKARDKLPAQRRSGAAAQPWIVEWDLRAR
jgi:hypothetical protein